MGDAVDHGHLRIVVFEIGRGLEAGLASCERLEEAGPKSAPAGPAHVPESGTEGAHGPPLRKAPEAAPTLPPASETAAAVPTREKHTTSPGGAVHAAQIDGGASAWDPGAT